MGFENSPKEAVAAAAAFRQENQNFSFLLFGDPKIIEPAIRNRPGLECVPASQTVEMSDTPITARRKTRSSMHMAIAAAADGRADAVVSAGSSGAYTALAYSMIGKISPGIKPGFMSWLPTLDKKGFYFLDVGANKEFSGKELYALGLLANQFLINCKNVPAPRVGLLNIGTEDFKGFAYHQEAHRLFASDASLNYVGFIEPRHVIGGVCDVLVADGYSGNLVLKALEGAFKSMGGLLKRSFRRNPLGALFSLNVIRTITKTFDYKNNAGALIMGLAKVAMKTHGSADFSQFHSTLRMTKDILQSRLIDKLKNVNEIQ